MPTYPLPYRISDFLNRQIAWTAEILAELETAGQAGDDTLDDLLEQQQRREREARNLAREYRGLAHEWQTAQVDEVTRASIQALSRQAQELTETVQHRYRQAQQAAEARAQEKHHGLRDLRRARRSVTIYRPEILESPGFIDKKA